MSHRTVLIAALAWLGFSIGAVHFGLLSWWLPAPFPQLLLVGLTLALLGVFFAVRSFRRWALQVDARILASIHLVRFVGAYFLILHAQGRLPYAFAVPGGWGDIVIAGLAAGLLWISPRSATGRYAWLAWNMVGLAEILFVVATAARLGLADPLSMAPLTHLPLGLLPTFVVPIIITTHVILLVQLARVKSERGIGERLASTGTDRP
jgi:hypothetical protein